MSSRARSTASRLSGAIFATVLGAVVLTGCSQLDDAVASDLQGSVQQVASYSAASDTAAALAELDALQQKLDAAVASGDVSADRAEAIQAAADLVRADINGIIEQAAADKAAAEAQAQAEADAAAAEEQAAKEAAAAEEQAAEDARQAEEDAREAAENAAEEARQAAEDAAEEAEEAVENGPGNGNGSDKPGKEKNE
jgi:hypothetical protein